MDLPINSRSFRSAQKFFDFLQQETVTIQIQPDKNRKKSGAKGETLWNGTEGSSSIAFTGNFQDVEFKDDIILLQNNGYTLWFMVNEGDGEIHDGAVIPRSHKSVKYFSACFIDTDNGSYKRALSWLKKRDLTPSAIVESSPGKYHIYLKLDRVPRTNDAALKWEAIQRVFMSIDPLFDQSMSDISKLLRVPHFYHWKKEPFLIRIVDQTDEVYDLDELFDATNASKHVQEIGQKFEYPDSKIESGSRHYKLVSYLRHLSNTTDDREVLLDAALGFARRKFIDFKEFMPGNDRYKELVHNVDSVVRYQERERVEKLKETFVQIDKKREENTFHLDDQFYFDCPNGIGDMVKESTQAAQYPCAAVDFAGFLSFMGTIKSHLYVTTLGHAPANYFINIAPAGRGKNHIQNVLDKAANRLYLSRHLQMRLTSEKGLYRALAEGEARVLGMIDEVEYILQSATSTKQRSEHYQRGLKSALLLLYSSTHRSFKSALTGNQKDTQYSFMNAHLNLCVFGTETTLTQGFSVSSISDGFLPRFIIIVADGKRELNEQADPDYKLSDGHMEFLRSISLKGNLKRETQLRELEESKQELSETDSASRRKELKASIGELEKATSYQALTATKIRFTDKAERHYKAFQADQDAAYNKEIERGSGLGALHTRSAEQVGRLCAVIGNGKIESDLVDYCVTFINSRVNALKHLVGMSGMNLSDGSASSVEMQNYYRFKGYIEKKCTAKNNYTIKKRELFRNFGCDRFLIDRFIKHAVAAELIEEKQVKTKAGRKFPAIKLLEIEE